MFVPRCAAGSTRSDKRLPGKKEKAREGDVEGIRRQTGFPREYEQMRQRWCLLAGRGVTTQRSISRKEEMGKTEVENKERS